MIPVRIDTLEEVLGNPTLTSLDGETRAPLATIMASSWTNADRAVYGIAAVSPATIPDDKVAASAPRFERIKGGVIVQVVDLTDYVEPQSLTAEEKVTQLAESMGLTLEELSAVLAGKNGP